LPKGKIEVQHTAVNAETRVKIFADYAVVSHPAVE